MTNRKDLLDTALLRAGRIELHIKISLPDYKGRKQIFRIHTNKIKQNGILGDVSISKLAKATENYSGAEIEAVVKKAINMIISDHLATDEDVDLDNVKITQQDLEMAIAEVKPSMGNNNSDLNLPSQYIDLTQTHKDTLQSLVKTIKSGCMFKRVCIIGEQGVGKTTLISKLFTENLVKYTKIIGPHNFLSLADSAVCKHIVNEIDNVQYSKSNLIALDDLDLLMNYAKIGSVVTFSNSIYQAIVNLLKYEPKSSQLIIVATTSNLEFSSQIRQYFDEIFTLKSFTEKEARKAADVLNIKNKSASTIRELLTT